MQAKSPQSLTGLQELLQLLREGQQPPTEEVKPPQVQTRGKLQQALEQHYYHIVTDPKCEQLIVALVQALYLLVEADTNPQQSARVGQLEKCLWSAVKRLDPSLGLIKEISRPLAVDYEREVINAGKLHLFIRVFFENQTPVNRDMNSFLYLARSEGIVLEQPLHLPFEKHPFEEGGTFSFWFMCERPQEEAKLLSLLTKQRAGFEIFLRSDKLYYQPLYAESSKSWIKPKSTPVYLSDLPMGRPCSLSIEFELKRKIILKSTWLINLYITSDRQVNLNGIEIDMPYLPSKELTLEMFRGFEGCISSVLLLSKNLARHLEENNIRGFLYENEIRNFTFLSEGELKHVVLLYTPIRSARRADGAIELFDVYGRNNAVVPPKAGGMLLNLSIKKEIGSYGGLAMYLSVLRIIEDCPTTTPAILNDYLRMLINIFLNKSGAQQEAASLNAFAVLKEYLARTRMKLVEEETVYLLKELFCSLSNKGIRQLCLKTLLWGLDVGEYLPPNLFELYMKGLNSLYNEDLQSTLPVFGIRDIINYILDVLEAKPVCCRRHGLLSDSDQHDSEYQHRLRKYFEIIQSIIEQKCEDASLSVMVLEVLQMFTLKMSVCLCEVLLDFIQGVASRSTRVEEQFSVQLVPIETKLLVYSLLANVNSVPVKARVLKLIFKWHGDELVNRERVAAYQLSACLRVGDSEGFKNSVMSHDEKISMDSEDKSSEPKSSSLTQLLRNWNRKTSCQRFETMDHPAIVDAVIEWTYNQPRPEDSCNNGLLLLADLYCMASTSLKKHMWHEVGLRVESTRFDPDLLLWLTEALLIQVVKHDEGDQELIGMILEIIVYYEVELIIKEDESNENAAITSSIVQTVFAAKFGGASQEAQLVAYLYIFEAIMRKFDEVELSPEKLPTLGRTLLNSCYKHLIQYFMLNNFDNESDFEQTSEDVRLDTLPLKVLSHLLSVLRKLVNTGSRLTSEQSSATNQKMLTVLLQNGFDVSSSEQEQRPSLLCMVFISLQSMFDLLDDVQLELKQSCLRLVEDYLLLMMELSENSGSLNLKPYEAELSATFMNVMSFLEIKFYQYFHSQPERGTEEQLQNVLRHNAACLSQRVVDVFVRVLELLKYIDEVASREHRSFYELMRRNKNHSRFKLNCLYPQLMKQIDDRVIEFYYIENVGTTAREKLEASLLDRKISRYSSSIEHVITKKMDDFLQRQKRAFNSIVSGSLSKYNDAEKDKYRLAGQFEEKLNLLRLDSDSRQRTAANRRLHMSEKFRREVKRSEQKSWEASRLYEGIWACSDFYSFSQNDNGMEYNNKLLGVYERSRSSMQTRSKLKPFVKVKLRKVFKPLQESLPEELVYIDNFAPTRPKVEDPKKSERYLKLGLQFIKKKFIDRIMRPSHEAPMTEEHHFLDVLWNHKLSLWSGDLRLSRDRLEFSYKQPGDIAHLTLFKFRLRDDKPLVRSWKVSEIESLTFQKFLLRTNTVELLFKNGCSLLFTFLNDANKCVDFAESIARVKRNLQPDVNPQLFPTKILPPMKLFEKSDVMRKWLNGELSNFDYLLALNFISGRSNEDLNQYPVMPWIRSQYDSTKNHSYRDLSRNMGCLGAEERRERFRRVFESSQHFGPTTLQQQFHYGFHYSNLPIVLQYLIRCNPYTEACRMLQGGKFDVPDRLFSSLADSFNNATREMSDVREVIPEFYYFPEFLINSEEWNFGVQQNNHRVDHVDLPEGCSNAYEFIEGHREALQSQYASENLHRWIDLVFGYRNSGKEAEASMNKFFYLTYEENVQLVESSTEDVRSALMQKKSMESQIAFYGKTPSQLLSKPHPPKKPRRNCPLNLQKSRRTGGYFDVEPLLTEPMPLHHPTKPFFNKARSAIVHFSYCSSVDKYVIVRRDGTGRVFSLDHKPESSGSLIDREFKLDFDRFEYSFCLDERTPFKELPIAAVSAESIIVGGVWGGRLLCFDITNDKVEAYCKHSETITAITHCESSKLIASGSNNGEVIVWEYNSKMKVLFRNKMVHHYSRVNHLAIEDELRLMVSAGEDGLVVLTNLFSGKLLRILRFEQPISWVLNVNYPYHMLLANVGNRQLCYSINGQFLDEAAFDVTLPPQIYRQMGFQDRVIFKLEREFVCLSLPDFRTQSRYIPNRQSDNNLSHFIVRPDNILYAVEDKVVYAYEPEEEQAG